MHNSTLVHLNDETGRAHLYGDRAESDGSQPHSNPLCNAQIKVEYIGLPAQECGRGAHNVTE